jgi:hypothetical protein
MRRSGHHEILANDLRKIQKNIKEKTEKEAEAIIQLIDLPDFDVS